MGQDRITVSTEVERLLTWAYRTEAIDNVVSAAGAGLKPFDVQAAGFSFGGGGGAGFGGAVQVNEQALMVHNTVLRLKPMPRGLVISNAKTGSRPDWLPRARYGFTAARDRNGKPMMDRDPVTHRQTTCFITHRHDPAQGIYAPSVIDGARVIYLYWAEALVQVAEWLIAADMLTSMPDGLALKPWGDEGAMLLDIAQKT